MSDSERREKILSVRLSQVEYELLKTHYRTYGAHNISDLARLALFRVIAGPASLQDSIAAKVSDLDQRVHVLEVKLSLIQEESRTSGKVSVLG